MKKFEGAADFSEGFAAVKTNGGWTYIDRFGSAFHDHPVFTVAEKFSEGLAFVCEEKQCGYINRHGIYELVFEPNVEEKDSSK